MRELIYKDEARRAVLHNQGDAAVVAIEAIKPVDMPEWIPVAERLPENDDDVLVFYKYQDEPGGEIGTNCYYKRAKRWCIDGDITHWMPLPEQPKGEEQ